MRIRCAELSDFAQIMELYGEASDAMAGTPYDCRWRRDGHPTRDFVRGLVERGGMLVVEDSGVLAGAVGFDHDLGHDYAGAAWLVEVPDELVCVVHLLVVRRDRCGEGLSRELLRACLRRACELGMRAARLDATANNLPAIGLYQSEGFVRVGEADLDVNPDGDSLVPFVVMERML